MEKKKILFIYKVIKKKKTMNKKEMIWFVIIMLVVGALWIGYTVKLDREREEAFKNCEPLLDINNKIQCQ